MANDDTMQGLSEFRELTYTFARLIKARYNHDIGSVMEGELPGVVYRMENGEGHGYYVLRDTGGRVAVMRLFMPMGTSDIPHFHHEREIGLVIEGRHKLSVEGEDERIMEYGDLCDIAPGQTHSRVVLEDTWMLFITIPPSEGYPYG